MTNNNSFNFDEILKNAQNIFKNNPNLTQKSDNDINKYFSRNLTELALNGKLDPVIGREEEVKSLIRILSRRTKNNPVLVGNPGVGKTAIVELLASKIVKNEVPQNLKNVQIFELSISLLLAGAKFQGEFESRINQIIKYIKKTNKKSILFIDELHTIIGAGQGQGALDAANILKPELARGDIMIIGSTTFTEYSQYIEKDSALERRFQKIIVSDPSFDETLTILRGLKERYENYHGVIIEDESLYSCVSLSQRYISDRYLPDKAIDLMDESCAYLKTQLDSMPEDLEIIDKKIKTYEIELYAIKKNRSLEAIERKKELKTYLEPLKKIFSRKYSSWQKEKKLFESYSRAKATLNQYRAILSNLEAANTAELEKISEYRYRLIPELEKFISETDKKYKEKFLSRKTVNKEIVANIISKWKGINVKTLLKTDRERLLNLENEINKIVFNQEESIKQICDAIKINRIDLRDPNKPIGVFLFTGPTGVGKTSLAKALALNLFDSEKELIRLDMSEYSEPHSISKIIGSPPGYIGYDQKGYLTSQVKNKPYSIILLDEIEKAHPKVHNLFLQIFDEGNIKDSTNNIIDFKNTLIIMTSNIFKDNNQIYSDQELINITTKMINNPNEKIENDSTKTKLDNIFSDEFLNRIDSIIEFKKLNMNALHKISKFKINEMIKNLSKQKYYIDIDEKVISKIYENSFSSRFGARPIDRYLKLNLKPYLSNLILEGKIKRNKDYILTLDNDDNLKLIKDAG